MLGSVLRVIPRAAKWSLRRFYHVERVGRPLPPGPVLVIANHPNSVVDALVIMEVAGRTVSSLAKAPLFEHPLIGPVLRALRALPVYRPQDFPGETARNEETFREAVAALRNSGAVLIFPEGITHSASQLAPFKTGAARIALRAEESEGWNLGLQVVPVGLTYERKHAFRGRVVAEVGEPLAVSDWRAERERDDWGAVESLTAAMGSRLERVTLNLSSDEERSLVEAAEALYAIEKRWARPRERKGLAPRLPRLRRFADAVAWFRDLDPREYESLAASVRTYRQRLALLGVKEGELPRRFPAAALIRYSIVQFVILAIGLPLAAVGTVAWYLPYKSPRLSLNYYRPHFEAVATFKLATALLAFPITLAFWIASAWFFGGWRLALGAAVVLPLAGFVAIAWRDRWQVVREDTRLFWRSVRRPSLRGNLVERRKALVVRFDELAKRWQTERRRLRNAAAGKTNR